MSFFTMLFRDEFAEFQRRGVRLIGVNFNRPESHKRFIERKRLPFPLLWDRQKRIAKRYGALGLWGLYCKRAYFLVDPKGRIAWTRVEPVPFLRRSNAELLAAIDRCQGAQTGAPKQ
ncbi:MAG: peroxiredoxin family protein [Candidatus Sumerlaeota bacterium]|nr:peroxiredoxin family protein [Candidatus Sumerlaeota bacterium]